MEEITDQFRYCSSTNLWNSSSFVPIAGTHSANETTKMWMLVFVLASSAWRYLRFAELHTGPDRVNGTQAGIEHTFETNVM